MKQVCGTITIPITIAKGITCPHCLENKTSEYIKTQDNYYCWKCDEQHTGKRKRVLHSQKNKDVNK